MKIAIIPSKNTVRLLGYKDMFDNDRKFLMNQLPIISTPILKEMVEMVLAS